MKPQSERAIIQVAPVVRDLEKAINAYSTEPIVGIVIELGNNGKIPPPEQRLP
jgi:hypothetical protein